MTQRKDFYRRPDVKKPLPQKKRELFRIAPLVPHFFIIAITIGIYYYINTNQYFPEWIGYIYWAVKIIIGFEVLAAAASTLWGPILGILSGAAILFSIQVYNMSIFSVADGWQLIIVSIVGFLVTMLVRF